VTDPAEGVRLQKVLAQAGIASRRACEALISEGRVEVNSEIVFEQGRRVDPERDVIRVDGARIPPPRRHRYLALNKPRGVVSTMDDPEGRRTLADLLSERGNTERLFHVGRLDTDTEGLLILTNDGDFAHRLAHPSYEVKKTYLAQVSGSVPRDLGRRLRSGIELEDGPVAVDSFDLMDTHAGQSVVEIVLHEGRKHIVRRLLAEVGLPVNRLTRTAVGPIELARMRTGTIRKLTRSEVGALHELVGL
jgi:23S rRNA pseudouridine2605 synthase